MTRTQGTRWHTVARSLALLALAGCESSSSESAQRDAAAGADGGERDADLRRDAGERDADPPLNDCERRRQAFETFVETHSDCAVDTDCAVIGDCSPNADFRAVRVDAAEQAFELQNARCEAVSDGPVFDAVCQGGSCSLVMRTDTCCGCPGPFDGGSD